MKAGIAILVLCTAASAFGRGVIRPTSPELLESSQSEAVDQPAPPLGWRATQINRCVDAKGRVTLQDLPCAPVVSRAASIPAAAAEIADLATLEHRPLPGATQRNAREQDENSFSKGLIQGTWRLGLFLLLCYGIYRLVRFVRDALRHKRLQAEIATESMRYARSTRPTQHY